MAPGTIKLAVRTEISHWDGPAEDWLDYFLEVLGFPRCPSARIFFVPGNHDICIPLAAAERVGLRKQPRGRPSKLVIGSTANDRQRSLREFAFRPYDDFVGRMTRLSLAARYTSDGLASRCWTETRFRHLGISFYGVNTSQPIQEDSWPDRRVDGGELAFVSNSLRRSPRDQKNPHVVVGLGHHSPLGAHQDRSVKNPEEFRTFFNNDIKTSIFLHGHIHEREVDYHSPGDFRLVRSCASTLTKSEIARPSDSLRGFTLLKMARRSGYVESMVATSFDWISGRLISSARDFVFDVDGMFTERR